MNLIALEDTTIKKRVVQPSMLRKAAPGAIVGILAGSLFSILGKLGIAASLAGIYAAFVLPRPFLALLIFIFSIPIGSFRLAGIITPTLALGLVAFIVAIFYFLGKGLRLYFDPLHILVAGIVFLASISVLYGNLYTDDQRYLGHPLTELRRYWLVAVFYLITFSLVRNICQVKQIMWVIVISCSILAFINILQTKFQFSIPGIEREDLQGGFFLDTVKGVARSQGTAVHPVESALMLQVSFFVSLFLLMVEKSLIRRWVLILTTFLIIPLGWSCTFARGSMVALLATIPYIIIRLRNKLNKQTIAIVFGAIFIALAIVPFVVEIRDTSVVTRFSSIFQFSENIAYRWRVDLADAGFKLFQDHPVFGIGVGKFASNYMQYLRPDHVKIWGYHPNNNTVNSYLTFAIEMGAVGLLFFILLLVFALRNLLQAGKCYSQKGDKASATIILGLEFAFWSLIMAHMQGSIEFLKYFWLLIALSAITRRLAFNAERQEFNK